MSATALLTETRRRDIALSINGDKLHVDPWPATEPDLIERLRAHKPELLAALKLEAAAAEAVKGLGNLSAEQYLAFLSPEDHADFLAGRFPTASFRAHAIARSETLWREQGIAPPWWTATALCDRCGPIFWPEPAHLPNCVWCWNRLHGVKIPRPDALVRYNRLAKP